MSVRAFCGALVVSLTGGAALAQDVDRITLEVTHPVAGQFVDQVVTVEGAVSEPSAEVWVIVRPAGSGLHFVQPPATVQSDGSWSSTAYFGREGDDDVGVRYDLRAVANPFQVLSVASPLDGYPESVGRSAIVRDVIRR
ncbi:MAG: hypothetical protein MI723_02265 [Caulobacterales bacterium]|nr:hypothetical protein [Caulobacterales bacterium]